jgi:hypothetical protein
LETLYDTIGAETGTVLENHLPDLVFEQQAEMAHEAEGGGAKDEHDD